MKAKLGLIKLREMGVAEASAALSRADAQAIGEKENPLAFLQLKGQQQADDINSPDIATRRAATRRLALHGLIDEEMLPPLLAQLKAETDEQSVVNLLQAIASLQSQKALDSVRSFLGSSSEAVRGAAVDAVAATGELGLDLLLPLLRDPAPSVIGRACRALEKHPYVDVGKFLSDLATHCDASRRKLAAQLASEADSRRYGRILERLASDQDADVATTAKDALGFLGASVEATPKPVSKPGVRTSGRFAMPEATSSPGIRVSGIFARPLPELPSQKSWLDRVWSLAAGLRAGTHASSEADRAGRRWAIAAALAVCSVLAIIVTRPPGEKEVAPPDRKQPVAPAQPRPRPDVAARQPGTAMSLTGTVTSAGAGTIILKSKYTLYYIEFSDRDKTKTILSGQTVQVDGTYTEWDEEAGVVRMAGLKLVPTKSEGKPSGG